MKALAETITYAKSCVGQGFSTDLAGQTNSFGEQCVAWVSCILTWIGYPSVMHNNAMDIYTKNPLGLQQIPASEVQAGDIGFMPFGTTGHTFYILSVQNGEVTSTDQNFTDYNEEKGSPVHLETHKLSELTGGLRPVYNNGGGSMFTEEDRKNWNIDVYGQYDRGYHEDMVGKDFRDAIYGILASAQFKDENKCNAGDLDNYLGFFANVKPTQADYAFHVGQTHKFTIYDLMDRADVKAQQKGSLQYKQITTPVFEKE